MIDANCKIVNVQLQTDKYNFRVPSAEENTSCDAIHSLMEALKSPLNHPLKPRGMWVQL